MNALEPTTSGLPSRRRVLALLAGAAVGLALPGRAEAASATRALSLHHTHTREALDVVFAQGGRYVTQALTKVNGFLRDFRTGDVHAIDPALLDLLHALHGAVQGTEPFHVISGYRSPRTNGQLRARSSGVARYSLHMEGRAVDIRLPGVRLATLREAALDLRLGGVGFYPGSDFVHVDTGRVRTW